MHLRRQSQCIFISKTVLFCPHFLEKAKIMNIFFTFNNIYK